MKRVIGLITARGGSKGVPRKNVRHVGGKPLISWTIEAALMCASIESVFLSTDDPEIASVGSSNGISQILDRPAHLAADDSPHSLVVVEALGEIEERIGMVDYIVLLQPTSPLRVASDIDMAVALALDKAAESVISVVQVTQHPYLAGTLDDQGRLSPFMDVPRSDLRRQALPDLVAPNGAVYVLSRAVAADGRGFSRAATYGILMPPERSLDIDTEFDLLVADLLLRRQP